MDIRDDNVHLHKSNLKLACYDVAIIVQAWYGDLKYTCAK